MRYTYRGDKLTDPALKGMQCDPVKYINRYGKLVCVRGWSNMLVVDATGRRHVVVGKHLRVNR